MGGKSGLVERTAATVRQVPVGSVEDRVEEMFSFAAERHAMQVRRSRGENWPWTSDPILTQYHFCNIFRELDKTTVWIKRQYLGVNSDHPNLWFAACLARRINYPPTLQEIGFPHQWDPERVLNILRSRMARGDKTFNPNAYRMVGGSRGKEDLASQIVWNLLHPVWEARALWPAGCPRLEEAVHSMLRFDGWGPMVSYQVALDAVGFHPLPAPLDQQTWTNVGPGGIRGLNRVFGRDLESGLTYRSETQLRKYLDEIRWLGEEQVRYWPRAFPKLFACDVENILCETDKYKRILDGALHGQRKYDPHKPTWSFY